MSDTTLRALAILEHGTIYNSINDTTDILNILVGYRGEEITLKEDLIITYLGSDIIDIDLEEGFYVKLIFVEIENKIYMLEYNHTLADDTTHVSTTELISYSGTTYEIKE